jgi:hypothetical protein
MPFHLLKVYNQLLELEAYNSVQRTQALQALFDRDFTQNPILRFKNRPIQPTPKNGEIPMATLFTHLTTVMIDKQTRKRVYEGERSNRLHWIKFHLEEQKADNMLHFSVKEPEGIRTYIFDITENYVIVLEPLNKINEYYLLTAYYLTGKDLKRNKILQKYKRRMNELY